LNRHAVVGNFPTSNRRYRIHEEVCRDFFLYRDLGHRGRDRRPGDLPYVKANPEMPREDGHRLHRTNAIFRCIMTRLGGFMYEDKATLVQAGDVVPSAAGDRALSFDYSPTWSISKSSARLISKTINMPPATTRVRPVRLEIALEHDADRPVGAKWATVFRKLKEDEITSRSIDADMISSRHRKNYVCRWPF